MSRADTANARLRRLRRVAARHGLTILAAKKPDPKFPDGGYMISAEETRTVFFGNKPVPYAASLDAVENYIDGLDGDGADAEP